LLALLVLGSLATPSFAAPAVKVAGLTFDTPKGWKLQKDGDQVSIADKAKDEEVLVLFVPVADGSKEHLKKTAAGFDKAMKNLKCEAEKDVELNDIKGRSVECTGLVEGKAVDLTMMILDTPTKGKDLFILSAIEHSKAAGHDIELLLLFQSVRPS
jgi:hypothetical protein